MSDVISKLQAIFIKNVLALPKRQFRRFCFGVCPIAAGIERHFARTFMSDATSELQVILSRLERNVKRGHLQLALWWFFIILDKGGIGCYLFSLTEILQDLNV
jgi:hypothetical protein